MTLFFETRGTFWTSRKC